MESQQRQWAAVSQIQGCTADRHDGETQAPPPWSHSPAVQFPHLLPSVSFNAQGNETTFHTQAAQAEADAPPATTAARRSRLPGLQETHARPMITFHLVVVVPCLSQDTREARLEKARLRKGEAAKAEGWAQGVLTSGSNAS